MTFRACWQLSTCKTLKTFTVRLATPGSKLTSLSSNDHGYQEYSLIRTADKCRGKCFIGWDLASICKFAKKEMFILFLFLRQIWLLQAINILFISPFRDVLSVQEPHVNTCYKHFYYFVTEFDLIEKRELEPLVYVFTIFLYAAL